MRLSSAIIRLNPILRKRIGPINIPHGRADILPPHVLHQVLHIPLVAVRPGRKPSPAETFPLRAAPNSPAEVLHHPRYPSDRSAETPPLPLTARDGSNPNTHSPYTAATRRVPCIPFRTRNDHSWSGADRSPCPTPPRRRCARPASSRARLPENPANLPAVTPSLNG